jgi:hypothetical protein
MKTERVTTYDSLYAVRAHQTGDAEAELMNPEIEFNGRCREGRERYWLDFAKTSPICGAGEGMNSRRLKSPIGDQ